MDLKSMDLKSMDLKSMDLNHVLSPELKRW
jgi:hypothetical protein